MIENTPFLFRTENAHQDDIHAMISQDNSFITGSKDTTIKRWETTGSLKNDILTNKFPNYRKWITALSTYEGEQWISGNRKGGITIWEKNKKTNSLFYKASNETCYCKNRNINRINCITSKNKLFFTGTPKYFQIWNKNRLLKKVKVDDNDWVYQIDFLTNRKILLVIGSRLEIWKNKKNFWRKDKEVFSEYETEKTKRPHIASLAFLDEEIFSTASFDGTIKIIDLSTETILKNYDEHKGRAWKVIKIDSSIVISGADDKTMKIWDIRKKDSITTKKNHPGRVSNLLSINNIIISASCPDDVFNSKEKACLTFWDIRKLF